jgi:hypothetical protein
VATGSATATDAVFDGATLEEKILTVTFRSAVNPATKPKVVIDFDLKNWNLVAGIVTASGDAFVKHGNDDGINDSSRHEQDDYSGTVSALSGAAPVQTFTINKKGRSINVATDASTVIFNNNGTDNPALTNGLKVEVTGIFDTTANVLKARRVKVERESESDDEAKVKGTVTGTNEALGMITTTIDHAEGFVPQATTALVATTETTKFFGRSGINITKAEFFAMIVNNVTRVEAEGISTSGIGITAMRVKIEDGDSHGGGGDDDDDSHHEAELKGRVSNLNLETKTFDLTVSRWEGVSLTAGAVVKVTAPSIPADVVNGARVEAEGRYDVTTSTLMAKKVKLDK